DQIGAANVRVLVNAARFERPRVVDPSVNLEVFVGVAERQIVNVRPEFVDLRHGQRGNGAIELPLDVGVYHHHVETPGVAVSAQLIDQGRKRLADRRAVPDRTEYADAGHVNERPLTPLIVPGDETDDSVVIDRFEQLDEPPL